MPTIGWLYDRKQLLVFVKTLRAGGRGPTISEWRDFISFKPSDPDGGLEEDWNEFLEETTY